MSQSAPPDLEVVAFELPVKLFFHSHQEFF